MKKPVLAQWADESRPFLSTRQIAASILRGCKARQRIDSTYQVRRESAGRYRVTHGNVVSLLIMVKAEPISS